ncbi:MAG: hypothetical protein QOH30_2703, partial [Baekduia sp.]|nr:hypothetical protein [Baekduia sp.]
MVVDPVGHVHEAEDAEREGAVGHQAHGQGEREDVEVGGGQLVAQ